LKDFFNGNSFTFLYCVSKELNFPLLSAKCAIAQVRFFLRNGKSGNVFSLIYLEIYRVVDVMHGIKKVKILAEKLNKFSSKKAILNFYLG
jgi:hypothetical protein